MRPDRSGRSRLSKTPRSGARGGSVGEAAAVRELFRAGPEPRDRATWRGRRALLDPRDERVDRGAHAREHRAQRVAIRVDAVVIVELPIDVVTARDDVVAMPRAAMLERDELRVDVGVRTDREERVLIAMQRDQRVLDVAGVRDA